MSTQSSIVYSTTTIVSAPRVLRNAERNVLGYFALLHFTATLWVKSLRYYFTIARRSRFSPSLKKRIRPRASLSDALSLISAHRSYLPTTCCYLAKGCSSRYVSRAGIRFGTARSLSPLLLLPRCQSRRAR